MTAYKIDGHIEKKFLEEHDFTESTPLIKFQEFIDNDLFEKLNYNKESVDYFI